jgi:hypothetical protein
MTARIAAEGKLVDPKKVGSDEGPDGYARSHLTLSEIAFDSNHELAAFVSSASCGCKGGSGGTVVYELKNGHWKRKTPILNFWQVGSHRFHSYGEFRFEMKYVGKTKPEAWHGQDTI